MKNDVFITGTSCYFPNKPVSNEDMEEFLGLIAGKHSRVKPVILKQNGIKQRYYALTKRQEILGVGNNRPKGLLIPHDAVGPHGPDCQRFIALRWPRV